MNAQKTWSYYTWPTFIICIFLATAALNVTSFTLAKRTYDKPFSEKAWDESLVYERIVEQKRNALTYNLSAKYSLEKDQNGKINLVVVLQSANKDFVYPTTLSLVAMRPADSTKDTTLSLTSLSNGRYIGVNNNWLPGLWYLKLSGVGQDGMTFLLENQVNL